MSMRVPVPRGMVFRKYAVVLKSRICWRKVSPPGLRASRERPVHTGSGAGLLGGGRRDGRRSKLVVRLGELHGVAGVISVEGVRLNIEWPWMLLHLI